MGAHSASEDSAVTRLSEVQLVQLRCAGVAAEQASGGFVDPRIIHQCMTVLDRRGEAWAASVLGRNISQRSLAVPNRPYLRAGEDYTLVAANAAEDRAAIDYLDPDAV